MRRALLFMSVAAAFIAIADGLAMMLPGRSSLVGGVALFAGGSAWMWFGLPRFLARGARPFTAVGLSAVGVVLLPALYLPVRGLWLFATPAALTLWFTAAWMFVWLVCIGAVLALPCPACGRPFFRAGRSLGLRGLACSHCKASPPRATAS